jgi:radical SAM protein with 4Fe4S-binding SPASM domain
MFSVIMPVWNRAGIVGRAIESILEQSYQNLELIVVDDGSIDDVDDVVKHYLPSGKVTFLQTAHRGVSAARNTGIRNSKGDFIAYLDSDNVWRRDYLSTMNDVMLTGKYDGAYCQARRFIKGPGGELIQNGLIGQEFSFKDLLNGNYIDLNTFVHARKMIDVKGGFDEALKRLTDWDFIIRVAGWGRIEFVREILVDYYWQVEDNAISLIEDIDTPLRTIQARYPALPEPVTLQHDLIDYVFESISDEKYRNYWLTLQGDVINRIDYRPCCKPAIIQIEPTNICNLQCPLCPVGQKALGRPPRHMTFLEFCKIVDDIEDHAMLLVMWDWGEPFMNPELPEMIRYATDKGIRTVVSTNAHFLKKEQLTRKALLSGLSTLIVAIDSIRPTTYQKYRKNGSLSQALDGLRKTVEIKKAIGSQTTINLRMVVMRQNEREVARIEKLGKRMGVDVFTAKTANPGYESDGLDATFVPRNPYYRRLEYRSGTWERIPVREECRRLWFTANISSNGNVIPCCDDYNGSMKAGNAFEDSFGEIWQGSAFASIRRQVLTDRNQLPHCSRCLINYKHTPHGMFCHRDAKPPIPSLALRFYVKVYAHTPEPIRLVARKLKQLGQRHRKPVSGNSLSRPLADGSSPPVLVSRVCPLSIPLPGDSVTGFRSYPIFKGMAASIGPLASHVSVLSTGISPHAPHVHDEEEILFLLAGEVDLIFPDETGPSGEKTRRLGADQCVYYPAGFAHTLRTVSNEPANYVMFKWKSDHRQDGTALSFIQYDVHVQDDILPADGGFRAKLGFEGPTRYLSKLRCHVSTLTPGAGYEPHSDGYHVAIIVLQGEVETLGKRVLPHGIISYAAGEPHGMRNPGQSTAKYIVFEFHGEP